MEEVNRAGSAGGAKPGDGRAQRGGGALLARCRLCGRACGIDRLGGQVGPCRSGPVPRVARWLPHAGEEPPLSGRGGSGTIFFSGCSLRCLFCQNAAISQTGTGRETPPEALAGIMLALQGQGCHNVNLVSPTHYAPPIAAAVVAARGRGLTVPVVYNTHGFDAPEALACVQGKVDIYLVDMKYAGDAQALALSGVEGYREVNRRAVREMLEQVGPLRVDPDTGLAVRGVLVRILVLPGGAEGARASLSYLKSRFSTEVPVSLMAQYAPVHLAPGHPPLDRPLTPAEYDRAVRFAESLGFRQLWLQEMSSASVGVPDFSSADPFEF